MWTEITSLKTALAGISDIETCKIGVEEGLSPADYPMIRIVPNRFRPEKYGSRVIETDIYFGANKVAAEGLETVYSALASIEEDIIAAIKEFGGKYIETFTDEDRLDTFKIMLIRCEIPTERPGAP